MHEPAYSITSAEEATPAPGFRTWMLPGEIPPGVQVVTLPGGYRTLAYTDPHPGEGGGVFTTTPRTAAAVPVAGSVPIWAKTTALLAPTVGAGIGAASFGLAYAAPGLIAMTQALWATVALIAAGTLAVPLLRLGAGRRQPVQITQNVTANGLFSRASGTINHR